LFTCSEAIEKSGFNTSTPLEDITSAYKSKSAGADLLKDNNGNQVLCITCMICIRREARVYCWCMLPGAGVGLGIHSASAEQR
jgi:hypothetical protein